MSRIGGITIATSSMWRRSQERGEAIKRYEERERAKANAMPSLWEQWSPLLEGKRKRMGVGMDGTMVPILEEGWKELKIGCVYELGEEPVWDEKEGVWRAFTQAQHQSYVAHLGGPKSFGESLWSEAQRRRWDLALDTQVIGDGAPWIWNLAALHFGDSQQVVDWYHAKAHLVTATRCLHPDDESFARALRGYENLLYQGHARHLAQHFQQRQLASGQDGEMLTKEATYFFNNARRMNYMELQEGHWLIGSGTVESEAKQFKQRFAGPGMRWSRQGIENLIPIRTAVMSGRFDDLWNLTFHPPPN